MRHAVCPFFPEQDTDALWNFFRHGDSTHGFVIHGGGVLHDDQAMLNFRRQPQSIEIL